MYLPKLFAEARPEVLHQILRTHPLGMLVTHTASGLDANHLPFLLDSEPGPHGRLLAHVARANPLWTELKHGDPVLVVFRGADGYISPNWYPSKQETHRHVPTWNYEVVHAHGRLAVLDDERFVRGLLARLTRRHEATEPKPWKMGDSAPDFIDEMLAKVVGIEIEIASITGKSKLSQNKEARDRLNAADRLDAKGQAELAQAMRQTV